MIHKVSVRVDEEGTRAAAAAVVEIGALLRRFRVDHPFLFSIRDRRTGALLFVGRLTVPRGG